MNIWFLIDFFRFLFFFNLPISSDISFSYLFYLFMKFVVHSYIFSKESVLLCFVSLLSLWLCLVTWIEHRLVLVWYIFFKILSKTLMFSRALFAPDYGHMSQPLNKHRIQQKRQTSRMLLFCDCSRYSYHKSLKKNINPGKSLLWFIRPYVAVFIFRSNATYLFLYNSLSCGRFVFFI